ncbi:hypothetical protein BGX31_006464 [Mortierella sp. GBA43]|nr:hypothetical protein BGX31_006464 [Mortierella sp. GBA43]
MATQEAPEPLHQHARHKTDGHHTHQNGSRNHTRTRTHPDIELHAKGASDMASTDNAETVMTHLVITNYRICSLVRSPFGYEAIEIEVPLGSIAAITLQDHRINISLKFDSPQYIIAQDPHGPPVVGEIMSCLRRSVFNNKVATWFPYQMGQYLLQQSRNAQSESSQDPKKARLRTAEDIIALSAEAKRKIPEYDPHSGAPTDEYERHILGWADGYDIYSEFQRLKFDESLWSVAAVNADFELSPTYPMQFIMPTSFLQQGEGGCWPSRGHTSKPSRHTGTQHGRPISGSPIPTQSYRPSACIKQLASFRSNRRFPIVCWKSPANGLTLMRSSQPMVGFLGARGPMDELYIRTVLKTADNENRAQGYARCVPKLCIMDARAYTSAVANAYVGGGRENPDHYPNASISFLSLGNIHVIASAHQAVLKAVSTQADSTNWHSLIESTGWLSHVADLLKAASGRDGVVGKMVDGNCSVLVHCTDGWDRTTQLVSLAQILMDPFYRTIHGLRVLIEKEWLSPGHPFQSRTSAVQGQKKSNSSTSDEELEIVDPHALIVPSTPNGGRESLSSPRKWVSRLSEIAPKSSSPLSNYMKYQSSPTEISRPKRASMPAGYPPSPKPEIPTGSQSPTSQQQQNYTPVQTVAVSPSPVFLLFLTCLHHIVKQHPCRFEYNDYLLVVLARAAAGSSPFGDFLYNNERERTEGKLRQETSSIWKWIQQNRGWFTNRDYEPEIDHRSDGTAHNWNQNVLQVQTGGPFTTLWDEYYFGIGPAWYPSPRTALSTPSSFYSGFEGWDPLSSEPLSPLLQHQTRYLRDQWFSSQFEEKQLEHLVFPGIPANNANHPHPPEAVPTIMPPAVALLKGEDMRMYFALVGHLKSNRKKTAQSALEKWRDWAKDRIWTRQEGWVVHEHQSKSKQPEQVYVEGKIEEVMGGIIEESFFGNRRQAAAAAAAARDTLDYANGDGSQDMDTGNHDREQPGIGEQEVDDLGGAFDDFGFPVDDRGVFVAV